MLTNTPYNRHITSHACNFDETNKHNYNQCKKPLTESFAMSTELVRPEDAKNPVSSIFPDVDIMSSKGYLWAVRRGVSGALVKEVIDIIGERELVAKSIGKDVSNLSRVYKVKALSHMASDNLIDTMRVYAHAYVIYQSMELAQKWMNTKIPALGGEVPVTLLDTHAGRELVRETLFKIEHGEFV